MAQALSPAAGFAVGTPNRALITASVMLATVMQVLDTTIANVALPHMQASLGAAQDTITWVLTSYMVASAIALPITGWLADRVGHKQLFLASIAGFVIASMLCGAATTLPAMVLFRVLQGIFGSFLVPLGQTVMLDIYPREKHGQAMALWGMGVMVGPVMGPVLGGWLTDNFSWRWVFYINLPIGILALAGVWFSLPKAAITRRRFDVLGFLLLAAAIGALQLMLDRGHQLDWFESWEIMIEAGVAIGAFWMFGVHLLTARAPLFTPRMLTDRNLAASLVFVFVSGILLFAGMALLPPMLQQLLGYPTVTAGLVIMPRGLGTMVSMMLVGRLIGRVDARLLVLAGLILMVLSLYQMTGFSLGMDKGPIITSGIVQGLSFGLIVVPLNALAFATLPPEFRTDASSLYNLVRNVGSSIGIAVVTTMLARNLQVSHADLASQVTPFSLPISDPGLAQSLGTVGDSVVSMLDLEINRQALMVAYISDFKLMMVMALVSMPLIMLLRPPRNAPGSEQVPHAVID